MIERQFYFRLLLIIAFGVIYAKTMMTMGQYKPTEETKKKNVIMIIIGSIFTVLALFEGFMGTYLITQVQHPTEIMLSISPNSIIRRQDPFWGYPTFAQQQIISYITNCMTSLGLGAYFLFFRKSNSKWWKKILKFIYGLLFYAFYVTATDFHYFDAWELYRPIIFGFMTFFVSLRLKMSRDEASYYQKTINDNTIVNDSTDNMPEQKEIIPAKEDDSRFMPKGNEEEIIEITELTEKDKPEIIVSQATPVYKFCRYCGKMIDYEGVKYCKHCGKPID